MRIVLLALLLLPAQQRKIEWKLPPGPRGSVPLKYIRPLHHS